MNLPFISDPDGISNNDYHHSDQFKEFKSSTAFKDWLISPKYARYKELNPEPEVYNPAFAMGSIWHDMLAALVNTGKADNFKKNWEIFEPPINETTGQPYGTTTNKFKDALDIATEKANGRELCSMQDVETARKMIKELTGGNPHLSKDINFLIRRGKAEISHFCEYEGYKFKYRTDLKTASKIIDWKTCPLGTAIPSEIHRQIIKFNYHISAAFYQFFDHLITGEWRSFYWVFQEKEPPYDFIIESADNWAYEISRESDGTQIALPKIGAITFNKLLEQYIHCRNNDDYQGYSSMIQPGFREQRIHESKVPIWYENMLLEYFN
jgi:hypothetical protein